MQILFFPFWLLALVICRIIKGRQWTAWVFMGVIIPDDEKEGSSDG